MIEVDPRGLREERRAEGPFDVDRARLLHAVVPDVAGAHGEAPPPHALGGEGAALADDVLETRPREGERGGNGLDAEDPGQARRQLGALGRLEADAGAAGLDEDPIAFLQDGHAAPRRPDCVAQVLDQARHHPASRRRCLGGEVAAELEQQELGAGCVMARHDLLRVFPIRAR